MPAQPAVSLSRRRLRSRRWSSCSSCACRGSPRWRCSCGASMPRVRRPGLRRVVTTARHRPQHKALRPTAQPYDCDGTGSWLSPRSAQDRRCCRVSPSQPRQSPQRNQADGGSASLVAVAMMAVLLALTACGGYVGSAVIARHRAQAAADLAALAAAVHLAQGVDAACTQASALARAMRTVVTQCVVEDLDVVVTIDAPVAFGRLTAGPAHASARAGPVGPAS